MSGESDPHVYTVDVVLHAHEPYPCIICGQGRNAPIHDIDWHERDCGIAGGMPHSASEHDLPPFKVVHIIEAYFCSHCGAMCPACVRTDEAVPTGGRANSQSPTSSGQIGSNDQADAFGGSQEVPRG